MAAVAVCSDFGAPQNKVCHCFHCFSIYLPWSDSTRCHDLCFLNVELETNFFTLLFIIMLWIKLKFHNMIFKNSQEPNPYFLNLFISSLVSSHTGLPGGISGHETSCQFRRCKRHRFKPWMEKTLGGGQCNPLRYSCLENFVDRGNWWATVHRVAKSRTWLKKLSMHAHILPTLLKTKEANESKRFGKSRRVREYNLSPSRNWVVWSSSSVTIGLSAMSVEPSGTIRYNIIHQTRIV